MSNNVKDVNINGIIYIEKFDLNNINIDEKSYKIILIYYIGHVMIKRDLTIYSVNPFYLIFGNVNGYFEENYGNKYLTLVSTNESKK